jgi:hypothetical protein
MMLRRFDAAAARRRRNISPAAILMALKECAAAMPWMPQLMLMAR